MDEQTTTDSSVADSGAENALPDEQTQNTSAEESTSEQAIDESSKGEETSTPEVDDKLRSFAKGQGIEDVSSLSERELKLLKVAADNKASSDRNYQRSTELEKATDQITDNQVAEYEQRTGQTLSDTDVAVQRLVLRDSIRTFFDENPEAKQYEAKMAELVGQKPHLIGDFDSLYALALKENTASLKSEAGKDALRMLANKQRATAPTGSAVTSSSATPKITRALMQEKLQSGDTAWLSQNREEINRMVADGSLR